MTEQTHTPTFADEIHALIRREIREVSKRVEVSALDPDMGEDHYDELYAELDWIARYAVQAQKDVLFLKTHAHEWGEDDRCVHCGADGRV